MKQVIKSDKAIIRAIAKAIINDRKEVIALISNYYKTNKHITTKDLLSFLLVKLANDENFANEFTELLKKKKYLVLSSNGEYHNWVQMVVGAVAGIANGIIGNQKAKQEGENAKDNVTAEMLKALSEEKEAKAKKSQMQNIIIIVSMVLFVSVAGIIVYKKM